MDEIKFRIFIDTLALKLKQNIRENDMPYAISKNIFENGLPFTNCINIKKSNIHGNGVFAINNIEPNLVFCIYQCDGIMINDQFHYYINENNNKNDLSLYNIQDYKINLITDENINIFGNPYIYNTYSSGHIINDSNLEIDYFKNLTEKNINIIEFGYNVTKYILNSLKNDNCVYVSTKYYVYLKTVKPINNNEELFVSYGYKYWCKNLKPEEVEIFFQKYISTLSNNQKTYILNLMNNLANRHMNQFTVS